MVLKAKEAKISIAEIHMASLWVYVLGKSPLIMHRFAKKAWQHLLCPPKEKNKAERAESLKHDPLMEYRECIYRNRSTSEPSAIHIPSGCFSKALAAAALDLPGASKSQILRLVSVKSIQINLFGTPMLGMEMVRSGDMARTPDVRTRAYFPEWACSFEIEFVNSLLGEQQIANLLGAAGKIVGVGDNRAQKGGVFGKFDLVDRNDPDFLRILKQGRVAQESAMTSPEFYDEDSAELYGWFVEEVARREKTLPSSSMDGKPQKQPKTPAGVLAKVAAKGRGKSKNGATA